MTSTTSVRPRPKPRCLSRDHHKPAASLCVQAPMKTTLDSTSRVPGLTVTRRPGSVFWRTAWTGPTSDSVVRRRQLGSVLRVLIRSFNVVSVQESEEQLGSAGSVRRTATTR